MQNTTYDWKYLAEPSKTAGLSLNDRRSFQPRGKQLGGSSAMNAMLYVRGNERDFDEYWQAASNSNWKWSSVLNYFKKSEKNLSPNADAAYHGFDGLLAVDAYPNYFADEQSKQLIGGIFQDLGFPTLHDINGESHIGFGHAQGTIFQGARHSAAKAFLHPSITGQRTNLHVIKMAHVTHVHIDKSKKVTGVEFIRMPETKTIKVNVKNEVILSAGSINTPQILMLSGIGPKNVLKKQNISVTKMLEGVGKNLQDHIIVPYVVSFHKSTAPSPSLQTLAEQHLQYVFTKSGMFANLGSTDYLGFFSTVKDEQYPDIQILNFMFRKQSIDTVKMLLGLFNYKANVIESVLAANQEADVLLIFVGLLQPKSRGFITLNSSDPFDPPKIYTDYLKEIEDVETLVRGIKIVNNISTSQTFVEHEGENVRIKLKECDAYEYGSDEYWTCYVRHLAITLYHPTSTAKMGPNSDKEAVVDAELNVHGIQGLRVADASIMPKIVSANTHAATMMIGEQVSDFIKRKWLPQNNIKNEL